MGTTTIFMRKNDFAKDLLHLDLKKFNTLNPFEKYKDKLHGWSCPYELHNRTFRVFIWRHGQLIPLEEVPKKYDGKIHNEYLEQKTGKQPNIYEWTAIKNHILEKIKCIDEDFKKSVRKRLYKNKKK